jgi:cobalt-zinc-cadmium efflux system outer membrane protein
MRVLAFIILLLVFNGVVQPKRAEATPGEGSTAEASASDTLTWAGAFARVERGNALLRALPLRSGSAAALVEQAGAWPNPDVLFEAENVDGSYSGFDRSEFSLWLSQDFELGGKRAQRASQARGLADEVARDVATQAFEIYLEAKSRYAEVAHAEERVRLATAAEAIVAELAASAEARVRSGATLTADAALATTALARARIAIRDAEAQRVRARIALSVLWGDAAGFDEPVSRVAAIPPTVVPADSAASWASASPAVASLRLARVTHRADAAVERGLRVPNLSLDAGARRIEADDASTFLFAVSMPLPLWDRRGGAVRAADARLRMIDLELEQARAETAGRLAGHAQALERLRERLRQTNATLIPSLTAALDNMRTAYTIGRVSYADLLEVQRALIELQNDTNDTRLAIVGEMVAIERLAGRPVEELMSHE